jgi:DNA polymerase-3 subunit epsilon
MDFVALDVETANPDLASICQVGIAVFRGGQVVEEYSTLVDPRYYFDPMNTFVHGIDETDVVGAPTYSEICGKVNALLQGGICATHTAFDRSANHRCCAKLATSPPDC